MKCCICIAIGIRRLKRRAISLRSLFRRAIIYTSSIGATIVTIIRTTTTTTTEFPCPQ